MEVFELQLNYIYMRDYYEDLLKEENHISDYRIKLLFNELILCEKANLKYMEENDMFECDINKAKLNVKKLLSVNTIKEMMRLTRLGIKH